MNLKNNWLWYLIAIVLILMLMHKCEDETIIKTETKIEYVKVTDTITNTVIQEVPKTVYVNRYIDKQGEKVNKIVYKPNDSTIKANQYKTKLESNNATADLEITTTGELLDVKGVINYTQENKTTTITKIKPKSGLFLYGQVNMNGFDSYGIGLDYQVKNKFIIGTSVNYDNFNQHFSLNAKIGIKLK